MKIEGEKNPLQGTEEWRLTRMGRFSCSQLWRLISEPKSVKDKEAGKLSDGAITYVMECVAEKLTGKTAKDDFTSKYTEWGIENEPIAVKIYEEVFGCKCEATGYIPHGENFGGSPDRLTEAVIDDSILVKKGFIEVKCPYTITAHLQHILLPLKEVGKGEYFWQVIGYFIVTGAEWGDFVSYHPDYPGKYQFKRQRLLRSDIQADIDRANIQIEKSTNYLNAILNSI